MKPTWQMSSETLQHSSDGHIPPSSPAIQTSAVEPSSNGKAHVESSASNTTHLRALKDILIRKDSFIYMVIDQKQR